MNIEQIYATLISQEPFFKERIQRGIERAKQIVSGELENEQAIVDRMKYLISSHFNIPFHSSFFDDLTLDDLVLEVMIISESKKDNEKKTSETIAENVNEAQDAFGDLMAEEDGEVEELPVPDQFTAEEQDFIKTKGSAFMHGGFAAVK